QVLVSARLEDPGSRRRFDPGRVSTEQFFEECMGSSHFINSTGSLWAIERDYESGRTRLVLGTQRMTGTQTTTIAEKNDHDWFTRVDDLDLGKDLLLKTAHRKQAWDLLPPGEFTYVQARKSVQPAMKSSGSFNPWFNELLRWGMIVKNSNGV